jgi:hypothetical protein
MTFACSIDAAARASRRKRSRALSSSSSSGAMTFSATLRPSASSWARYTMPIPPRPMTASIRNPETTLPGASSRIW